MARIVHQAFGSLGDLHPHIAVGAALRARGHDVTIATHKPYRSRVESGGLRMHDMPPDYDQFTDLEDIMRRAMDARDGSRYVLEAFVLPCLRETTAALIDAGQGADAIIGNPLGMSAVLAAEKLRIPHIHAVLQPLAMFSAHDPSHFGPQPGMDLLYRQGPGVWRAIYKLMRFISREWLKPVQALRAELGLPPTKRHPMFDMWSSTLNLALFSRELMQPQPDFAPNTVITGFPFHDRDETGKGAPESLLRFLDAGPAPIVFTLGSSAVFDAGEFYEVSLAASRELGKRAVLLCGPEGRNRPRALQGTDVLDDAIAIDYAPHSEVFPRALVNVHQGGVGTTGQALRSGRPMIVMPYSHDQPDNALRCRRLGIARIVARGRWNVESATKALGELLADPQAADAAAAVGARVRAERGAEAAADAIEQALAR
jgi:UDP:flavonoid glycosyltransferase YjiC (YdhE family)